MKLIGAQSGWGTRLGSSRGRGSSLPSRGGVLRISSSGFEGHCDISLQVNIFLSVLPLSLGFLAWWWRYLGHVMGGGTTGDPPQAGWGFLLAQPLHLSQPGWGDSHSWGRKQSSDPFLSRPLIITSCKDLLFHTTKWVNSIYGVFPVSECWWDQVTGGNLNGSLLSEACLIRTCPATQRYKMLKDHTDRADTEKTLLR